MAETLVDLAYRGVSLARRVKLTQVRPGAGMLELAAPMPVGTTIGVICDDGVTFHASVTRVREQVTGATAAAGMLVVPALADDAARAWWASRVELPPDTDVTDRVPIITDEPADTGARHGVRHDTESDPQLDTDVAGAAVAAALVAATRSSPATRPPPVPIVEDDHSRRTSVMDAATADVLVEMAAAADSNPRLVDDGKRTEMMPTVDLAALGLDPGTSARMATVAAPVDDEPSEAVEVGTPGGDDKPPDRSSTPGKRRRRKR